MGTGALFVAAGLAKLVAPDQTAAVVGARHVLWPMLTGRVAGVIELLGGALLLIAWQTRRVALALGVFVAAAAVAFHVPAALAGPSALELGFDAVVLAALYVLVTRA